MQGAAKGVIPFREERRMLFTSEKIDIDFSFSVSEEEAFHELWKSGISVHNIAKKLKRKPVEVALLVMDLDLCGEIKYRKTGIFGL